MSDSQLLSDLQDEATALRMAIGSYSTPTGQQVNNRDPIRILDAMERVEARVDRASEGIAVLNIGF